MPAREKQVPSAIIDWMESNRCRNRQVKSEIALCCKSYLKTGVFRVNKDRYQYTCGGQASQKLRLFLKDCPFVRTVVPATKRSQTAIHAFDGIDGFSPDEQSGESLLKNQSLDIYPPPSSLPSCPLSSLCIEASFLHKRAVKWNEWCDLKPKERKNRADYFGRRRMSRLIQDVISKIEFPSDLSFLGDLSDVPEKGHEISERAWCRKYLQYRSENPVINKVLYIDGRIYHPLITCPRPIRERWTIDGETVGEADLSASFFTLLASLLPEGGERRKAIDWVTSGDWYHRLQATASHNTHGHAFYGDEKELKRQTQIQCLFFADHHPENQRPLFEALREEFPSMASQIMRLRRNRGASGLCRSLTRMEGGVMGIAHGRLMDEVIPFLPNHDGIVLRQSDSEVAAAFLRDAGRQQLGFTPLVKAK